ncbi:MAG: bacterial Ig-like domain-containing protein [Clostridiales bacterium]|nr:bacterial Ig-like domain-containing protein [Clostridiales bacterium]
MRRAREKVKTLSGIEIGDPPSKTVYTAGEIFDPAGMTVTARYSDGSSEAVAGYTYKTDALVAGDTKITVTYTKDGVTKTADVAITVTDGIASPIDAQTPNITAQPQGATVTVGETFSVSVTASAADGGALTYQWYSNATASNAGGAAVAEAAEAAFVVPTDEAGTYYFYCAVTNSIEDNGDGGAKTAAVDSEVAAVTVNAPVPRTLTGITVTSAPNKTDYTAGETLNTLGLVVTAAYLNGDHAAVVGWSADKDAPLTVADTSVTVTYTEGVVSFTAAFGITVTERALDRIEVTSQPTKRNYVEGQAFDASGMVVTAFYDGGGSKPVADYALSVNVALTVDITEITVGYTEDNWSTYKTATITGITVAARVLTGLNIQAQPGKTEYKEGEIFDRTGMQVTAVYNDGAYARAVSYPNYTIGNAAALTAGVTEITVSYTEGGVTKTAAVGISVTARVLTGIAVTRQPDKTAYLEDEYFNILGLEITAQYDDGSSAVVFGWTYATEDALTPADTQITVTYLQKGVSKTAAVTVSVAAKPILPSGAREVVDYIDALPAVGSLTYNNAAAVIYASSLYDGLAEGEKAQVYNYAALIAAQERVEYLIANREYRIYYSGDSYYSYPDDRRFGGVGRNGNPTIWKVADGPIALNPAVSAEADEAGYVFLGWIVWGRTEITTHLDGLSGDLNLYAVYMRPPVIGYIGYDTETFGEIDDLDIGGNPLAWSPADGRIDLSPAASAAAAADGKVFLGWYDMDSGEPVTHIENRIDDMTLAALFGRDNFNVSYEANMPAFDDLVHGNPSVWSLSDGAVPLEDPASAKAAAAGYVFVRWEFGGKPAANLEGLYSDAALVAVFAQDRFNIIYGLDTSESSEFGDFDNGGNPAVWTKSTDGKVALNPASSEEADALGYVFDRWIDADSGNRVTYLQNLDSDATLLAVFRLDGFRVYYYSEYGNFDDFTHDNPITLKKGTSVELSGAVSQYATETGYVFAHWQYGGKAITRLENLTQNITLYAVFERTKTVEVRFVDKDGDGNTLYTVTVERASYSYDFDQQNVRAAILAGGGASGKYPAAFYDENDNHVSAVPLMYADKAVITVRVGLADAVEITLSEPYGWQLGYSYGYDENGYVGLITQGTSHLLPQGANIIYINIRSAVLTGITVNSLPYSSADISLSVDTEIVFTTTAAMTLVFNSPWTGSMYINMGAGGALESGYIDNIRNYFEGDEKFTVAYAVDETPIGLEDLRAYAFAYADGMRTIEVTRTAKAVMALTFARDYDGAFVIRKYDGWDGRLTSSDLSDIRQSIEGNGVYSVTYTVGGASMDCDGLGEYGFGFAEGVFVIEVTRANNFYTLRLYLFNGSFSSSSNIEIIKGRTVASEAVFNDLFKSAVGNLVLYTDAACTALWDGGLDTVPDGDLTLYAARREAFAIALDPDGGDAPDSFAVPADNGVYFDLYASLPEATREGYAFAGWEFTEAGGGKKVLGNDAVTDYIIANMNKTFVLKALWIDLEDAAESPLLGKWIYIGGWYLRVLEFNADGSGTWTVINEGEENIRVYAFGYTELDNGDYVARVRGADYYIGIDGSGRLHFDWSDYSPYAGETIVIFETDADSEGDIRFFVKPGDWNGLLSEDELLTIQSRYGAYYMYGEGLYGIGGETYDFDALGGIVFPSGQTTRVTVTRPYVAMLLEFRGNYNYRDMYPYEGGKLVSYRIDDLRRIFEQDGLYSVTYTVGGATMTLAEIADHDFGYSLGRIHIYVNQIANPNMRLRFIEDNNVYVVHKIDGWDGYLTGDDLRVLRDAFEWDQNYDVTYTVEGADMMLDDLAAYRFDYAVGTELSISVVKVAAVTMRLEFYSDYYYPLTIIKKDGWDGRLSEDDLNNIVSLYDRDSSYSVTYDVGGEDMTLAQLAAHRFEFSAWDTVVIEASRVNAVWREVRIYFANGGGSNYYAWMIADGKPIGETRYDYSDLPLGVVVNELVLYADAARTVLWNGDSETVVTGNLTLYAARRAAFTITFDAGDGEPVAPIDVPADNGSSSYGLTLPSTARDGYYFAGWSVAPGGSVVGYGYTEYFLQNRNKPVALYAVWVNLTDAEDSPLLGVWGSVLYGGDIILLLEFKTDGSGSLTRIENFEYVYVENFAFAQSGGIVTTHRDGHSYTQYLSELFPKSDMLYWFGYEYARSSETVRVTVYGGFYDRSANAAKLTMVLELPGNMRLSDVGGIVWYVGKTQASGNETFAEFAGDGTAALWKFRTSSLKDRTLRFIDLDPDGGELPEGFPSYIPTIGVWHGDGSYGDVSSGYMPALSDYRPVKDGWYFIGWQTPDGDFINNLSSLWHTKYQGVDGLAAVWIDGAAVDYAGLDIVGTWSGIDYDAYYFGDYGMGKTVLALNADGSYSYSLFFNGAARAESSGAYRLAGGRIVFLTGNVAFLSSSVAQNVDLRFVEWNILVSDGDMLVKGAVKPANYSGDEVLGDYRLYYKEGDPDGGYTEYAVTLTLYADGTFAAVQIVRYGYGDGDNGSQTNGIAGYFRVIDGQPVFLGGGVGMEDLLGFAVKDDGADYSALPILGTWIAADTVTQMVMPFLSVGADGIVTVSDPDGYSYGYPYRETAPGEYVAINAMDGIIFNVAQTADGRLVLETEVTGMGVITLTYVKVS